MKLGLVIGSFSPLHNGSLTLCKVANAVSEKIIIVVINSSSDQIPIKLRIHWLKQENPHAIVKQLEKNTPLSFEDQLIKMLKSSLNYLGSNELQLFSSDPSLANLAKRIKIKCTILDPERLGQNIKSADIIADPYMRWFDMPLSVRLSLIRRIVLIGPESVGKSTLAKQLRSSSVKQPFLPEYGRPYETFRKRGPYEDYEFEDIVKIHAAHRKALLPFSGPIFIEDTDELATAVWVEMLMSKRLINIEKQIKLPFLYLLMDPSVPFISETIRYFDNEKRLEFFNKIKDKLEYYKASYTIIKGDWATREVESQKIIKRLLAEKINWSKIIH